VVGCDQNEPLEIGLGGVEWINLPQDSVLWRTVVNAVMNLLVLAPQSYEEIKHGKSVP
jgi:hypothetical protein